MVDRQNGLALVTLVRLNGALERLTIFVAEVMPKDVPVGVLHFFEPTRYKADKILVTAAVNKLTVIACPFVDPAETKLAAQHPTGKFPVLETNLGLICMTNAVARYVARCRTDTMLCGQSYSDEVMVNTWLEFCSHELEVPLMAWVYHFRGLMEAKILPAKEGHADVQKALAKLEKQLKISKYLVGESLTLADIVIICALREGFTHVFDPAFRRPYVKVCEWFEHCCNLPDFKAVLCDVKMLTTVVTPKQRCVPPLRVEATPSSTATCAVEEADITAQVKALGDEIRALKDRLKEEGISGKKLSEHEDVKRLVSQLQELKGRKSSSLPNSDSQIKVLGDEIRIMKEKFKQEGLSAKQINEHEDVKKLVAQLKELKQALAGK